MATKTCTYCKKVYIKQKPYQKHVLLCMEIDNAKNNSFDIVPSQNTMYKMIKVLIKENKILRETFNKKITRLENKVFKKKNKINIIEWMDKQNNKIDNVVYQNYNSFISDITVKTLTNNLKYMLYNTYIESYFIIIKKLLKEHVLIAWEQKKTIYYYDETWRVFRIDDLGNLLRKIQRIVMSEMSDKKNEFQDDTLIHLHNAILGGVCDERAKNNQKIYNKIWDHLKQDVERHVEFKILF